MKNSIRLWLCLLILLASSAVSVAQEKPVAKLTIMVPEKGDSETAVRLGSMEEFAGATKDEKTQWYWLNAKGEGETRMMSVALDKTKAQKFKVEAKIQPNNYETITRYKEITLKGGDTLSVDLTKKLATDRTVARWYPTPPDIVDKMSDLAKITKNDVVYDLGCGDAIMLIRPLEKFGAKRGVGIDIDPKEVKIAKENVKKAKLEDKIEIREGDILDVKDMSEATVVLLYIGDVLGERLGPVLQKTMKPGSRIVSHRFRLGDWAPTRTEIVTGADNSEYTLHLWIVGEEKKKK